MAAFRGGGPRRVQTRCNSRHNGRTGGAGRIFVTPPRVPAVPGADLDRGPIQKPTAPARARIRLRAPLGFDVQVTSGSRQQGSSWTERTSSSSVECV